MKYNWENASEYAICAAVDSDGSAYWYYFDVIYDCGEWSTNCETHADENLFDEMEIKDILINSASEDSYERRPSVITIQYPEEEPENYFWNK